MKKWLAVLAWGWLAHGASAQTLSGMKVEPATARPGHTVKVTVDFTVEGAINCGMRIHFGDGNFVDYRINQTKDVPLVVPRVYSVVGGTRLMAEPKTVGLLGRCAGKSQYAVLNVVAPAPVAGATPVAPAAADGQAARTDPLTAYTLCVTAAYSELIGRFPDPTEAMARSRLACGPTRSVLEGDVRQRAGSAAPQVLLGIDNEILKKLRTASR